MQTVCSFRHEPHRYVTYFALPELRLLTFVIDFWQSVQTGSFATIITSESAALRAANI